MKTLIIYDSAFGNTEKFAFAMRDALNDTGARAMKPSEISHEDLSGLDLLVVGSPTQKFSPLKSIADYISSLPSGSLKNIKVAAFDTRIDITKVNNKFLKFFVFLFGYAAKTIAGKLRSKGGKLVAPPEGFFVDDTKGPVSAGELARAQGWVRKL